MRKSFCISNHRKHEAPTRNAPKSPYSFPQSLLTKAKIHIGNTTNAHQSCESLQPSHIICRKVSRYLSKTPYNLYIERLMRVQKFLLFNNAVSPYISSTFYTALYVLVCIFNRWKTQNLILSEFWDAGTRGSGAPESQKNLNIKKRSPSGKELKKRLVERALAGELNGHLQCEATDDTATFRPLWEIRATVNPLLKDQNRDEAVIKKNCPSIDGQSDCL